MPLDSSAINSASAWPDCDIPTVCIEIIKYKYAQILLDTVYALGHWLHYPGGSALWHMAGVSQTDDVLLGGKAHEWSFQFCSEWTSTVTSPTIPPIVDHSVHSYSYSSNVAYSPMGAVKQELYKQNAASNRCMHSHSSMHRSFSCVSNIQRYFQIFFPYSKIIRRMPHHRITAHMLHACL